MTESGARRARRKFNSHAAKSHAHWAGLPEKDLLQLRLKDLDLSLRDTWLERCLDIVNGELAREGLKVKAHAWLADEWFSPDNTPGIAFPFYLAHPRLARLERRRFLDVEGGTQRECLQIIRHECGHVIQHSFALHRRRKWQDVFGSSSTPYPSYYKPDPSSRDYVQHLRRWYAQSHPDEDFAETFAVWLTPRSSWRKHYAGWPALKKLEYVDELMAEIAGKKPSLTKRVEVDPISKSTRTLAEHYDRKLAAVAVETHTSFDRGLQKIFSSDEAHHNALPAATFVRRNRAAIMHLAEKWTGEYQVALDGVLDEVINRCRFLKLRAHGSQAQMRTALTAFVTKKATRASHGDARRWYAV